MALNIPILHISYVCSTWKFPRKTGVSKKILLWSFQTTVWQILRRLYNDVKKNVFGCGHAALTFLSFFTLKIFFFVGERRGKRVESSFEPRKSRAEWRCILRRREEKLTWKNEEEGGNLNKCNKHVWLFQTGSCSIPTTNTVEWTKIRIITRVPILQHVTRKLWRSRHFLPDHRPSL